MAWKENVSKFFVIPQRYVMGIMGFLAIVNAYTMRVSLSVAITEMVASTNKTLSKIDPMACTVPNSNLTQPAMAVQEYLYEWDEQTQGLILGSFYWGYVLTHLPGGMLAERFGGKWCLGFGIFSTAIFTFATPGIIKATNGNWKTLVALRFVEGMAEGPTYPALNVLLAKWVPTKERGRIGSLVYAGGQMGTIVSNLVSGTLIHATATWASVFYVFGAMGLLWTLLWGLLCYSDPQSHPFISDKEKKYLEKEIDTKGTGQKVPWKAMFTSMPLWALVMAQIGHDWGFFTMITDLPKYFKGVLKFDVQENGIWSSLPYLFMWMASLLSGAVCDWMISTKICNVTFARKFFTTIASVGPAVFMVAASYVGCERMQAVWLFTVAMSFMGTFYCGMKVNALDLAPNYAGTLMAIVNGIGGITGFVTPLIVGYLTEEQTIMNWRSVFWISFVVLISTNGFFLFFGSAEQQYWNDLEKEKVGGEEGRVERYTVTNASTPVVNFS